MSDVVPTAPDATAPDIEALSNLTRSQFLIWTGQQISPELPIYNMGWRFTLGAEIDPDRFASAVQSLVQAADTLRMTFELDGDVPRYAVGDAAAGVHQTHTPDAAAADVLVQNMISAPFDLSKETFRSALLHVDGTRWEWIIVQHHLVTDATSAGVLLDWLSEAYLSAPDTLPPPLPAYTDWAETNAQAAHGEDRAFWETAVQAMPAPPPLYVVDGQAQSARTRSVDLTLGADRTKALQAAIETDRFAALTPDQALFNIVATALIAWVHHVTDEGGIVLGVTTHGRATMQARGTAGLFMDTLPLHAKVAPRISFADLHAQVAETGLELMMHASPGASSAASHAKFNVVLNYIRASFDGFAGAPVRAEWLEHAHFDPAHALWVDVLKYAGSDALVMRLRLNAGLFPDPLKDQVADQILRVLDTALAHPDAPLNEIAIAGPSDRSRALTKADPWTGADTPRDICDAFASCLSDAPDTVAMSDGTETVTRAELNACANTIATLLAARGVQPGDRVGVYLTRRVHLVAALLGILKLGAAYVPLDPLQPIARLKTIAENAGLALTLTETALAARWPDDHPHASVETAPSADASFSAPAVGPEADAYVIFTSGSTGTPKGVRIARGALARYAAFAARAYGGPLPKTWALHSAIGFDLTVTSIFAPLVSGGVIRAYSEALDATDLSILKVFEEDAVDVVKLTPAHLALVTRQSIRAKRINTLILGGENLTTELARAAANMLGPDLALFNEYGPTEATVGCMIHRFDPQQDTGASVPIGQPADRTALYVLDAQCTPVAEHVMGEIYVAGPERLASGYLGLDSETRDRFLPNPFSPGTLMYRTGDLAHVDAKGVIHYHGRKDEQVKIGSVRVELGEIRNALLSHPTVADCVVTADAPRPTEIQRCIKCGLGSDHPDADIDESGVCRLCRDFDAYRAKAEGYFRTMDDLRAIIDAIPASKSQYDCLMLLSGGKDSSYALGQLAALTPRVLAVTLDNGFISEQAMTNISKVCKALDVDHRFISTPHMNEIFADSLTRYANVCNGCFKVIYTLGMQLAQREGIGIVVTGLSRGQLFETRLAPELFGAQGVSAAEIDRNVIEARRFYHRVPDATTLRLNNGFFDDDSVFERIQFIDFYRYCDVSVDEIYAYLDAKVPWLRPSDTGRSSNCLINDLGIYIHKQRRGYHNYALPYSWDVRTGHKSRNASLEELDDTIDVPRMHDIMQEIGYVPETEGAPAQTGLASYIVAQGTVDPAELRQHLTRLLPRAMVPSAMHLVPEIPLTPNGKVDQPALEKMRRALRPASSGSAQAPANETEAVLLDIWQTVLDRNDFGPQGNFFDFGGDSVHAISIASRASRAGLAVTALAILTKQTIRAVAAELAVPQTAADVPPKKRAALDAKSMDRLGALFGKRKDG